MYTSSTYQWPLGVSGGPIGLGPLSTYIASSCARGLGYGLWLCFGMQNTVQACFHIVDTRWPDREPEKWLPHLRKAAVAQITKS